MLSKLLPPDGNVFLSLTTPEKSGGHLLHDRFKSPWHTSVVWCGCLQQCLTVDTDNVFMLSSSSSGSSVFCRVLRNVIW